MTKQSTYLSQVYIPTLGTYFDVMWLADGFGITEILNINFEGASHNELLEVPGFKPQLLTALERRTNQIKSGKKYHRITAN